MPAVSNLKVALETGTTGTYLANGLGIDVNGNLDFFRNKVTYLPATTTGAYAHTSTENLVQRRSGAGDQDIAVRLSICALHNHVMAQARCQLHR